MLETYQGGGAVGEERTGGQEAGDVWWFGESIEGRKKEATVRLVGCDRGWLGGGRVSNGAPFRGAP